MRKITLPIITSRFADQISWKKSLIRSLLPRIHINYQTKYNALVICSVYTFVDKVIAFRVSFNYVKLLSFVLRKGQYDNIILRFVGHFIVLFNCLFDHHTLCGSRNFMHKVLLNLKPYIYFCVKELLRFFLDFVRHVCRFIGKLNVNSCVL